VGPRTVPVSAELVRLYADYLHGEYGELDSDYVFVNLWGEPHGLPAADTVASVVPSGRRCAASGPSGEVVGQLGSGGDQAQSLAGETRCAAGR